MLLLTPLIFPADTADRAGVYGILNFLFGGAVLIVHFRYVVVVQSKNIRATVHTGTAADAFILVYDH
jgi:hypothetical protein